MILTEGITLGISDETNDEFFPVSWEHFHLKALLLAIRQSATQETKQVQHKHIAESVI